VIDAEILGKYLVVEGFKDVKIHNIDEFLNLVRSKAGNCHIQVLDASLVAGFEHLYFAVLNALKSFEDGLNISKSLAVEILLFASGQDQIRRAIEILGVKPSSNKIALVIVADSRDEAVSVLNSVSDVLDGKRDQSVIELTDEKLHTIMRKFNISEAELEASMRGSLKDALKSILIERAALLVVQR